MWDHARQVIHNFREDAIQPDGQRGLPKQGEFMDWIEAGLKEGRPFIRSLCRVAPEHRAADASRLGADDQEDWAVNRLFLICTLLSTYMRNIANAERKRSHLIKDENGDPVFRAPDGEEGSEAPQWFEFLYERGNPRMFCPLPSKRMERLRKYVSILKTFWDISSKLRARRFCQMMRDNFPQTGGS